MSPTVLTDEGVAYNRIDSETITNLSDTTDRQNAKRRELHVAGKTYSHVGEVNSQWTYRHDH